MLILGLQKTSLLDYPHHVASTIFTGGCNFRCPYCHNGDLVLDAAHMEAYTEDEIFAHLNKRKNTLDGVCITGGEPTLQKDLVDFIKKVKEIGLKVKLDTNGSNPDILKNLLEQNLVDYVAMDIKNSPVKYRETIDVDTFIVENIVESVDILKKLSTSYEFRTTLCKELHTMDDIILIGEWLKGANSYFLQPFRDSDQVISHSFSAPDKDTLLSYVEVLKKYIPVVEIRGLDL